MVNAILIETDETQMTSGEIKLYIDGVECPDTNGVGIGAVGGVFNCGLIGSTFEAICTTTCSPSMSIVEIFLWKEAAMTLYGTPYYIADSHGCTADYNGGSGAYPTDTDKLFNTGSYWYAASSDKN